MLFSQNLHSFVLGFGEHPDIMSAQTQLLMVNFQTI